MVENSQSETFFISKSNRYTKEYTIFHCEKVLNINIDYQDNPIYELYALDDSQLSGKYQ